MSCMLRIHLSELNNYLPLHSDTFFSIIFVFLQTLLYLLLCVSTHIQSIFNISSIYTFAIVFSLCSENFLV